MTAEAKERNERKGDGDVTPRAARAGQRQARSQRERDRQRGKQTQGIPRMEKSDGNQRATEIVREIVRLIHRAEHRVDRLRGYVNTCSRKRDVVILDESACSREQARRGDPPLQRT